MSPFHDIFLQIFNSTERVLSLLQKTTLLIIRYGQRKSRKRGSFFIGVGSPANLKFSCR